LLIKIHMSHYMAKFHLCKVHTKLNHLYYKQWHLTCKNLHFFFCEMKTLHLWAMCRTYIAVWVKKAKLFWHSKLFILNKEIDKWHMWGGIHIHRANPWTWRSMGLSIYIVEKETFRNGPGSSACVKMDKDITWTRQRL
jgi:hypothetical protein